MKSYTKKYILLCIIFFYVFFSYLFFSYSIYANTYKNPIKQIAKRYLYEGDKLYYKHRYEEALNKYKKAKSLLITNQIYDLYLLIKITKRIEKTAIKIKTKKTPTKKVIEKKEIERRILVSKKKPKRINIRYLPIESDFSVGYFRGKKIVLKDNKTNLIWEYYGSHKKLVYKKATEYCKNLKKANFSWRLPSIYELIGLYTGEISYDIKLLWAYVRDYVKTIFRYHKEIKKAFGRKDWDFSVWSNTPASTDENSHWIMGFEDGGTYFEDNSKRHYVICIASFNKQ
jgi:hypothetical protein